ncbi:MAG: glutamate--tRNA ligase [Oscillospiraceae bacterium]|nr:glutamate--tRNA ligase [Oscillospiraceae bacterium]
MDYNKLADILFCDVTKTPEDYNALYPARNLPESAEVTRIAPSPTGFIHLGNLFGALADERIAKLSDGVFYLRIEDTDEKRKVEGAVEAVLDSLGYFGLKFDEGAEIGGNYGPYYQRQRADLYRTFAKELVKKGLAYPCFCTEEELSAVREIQQENKENTGYWGKYAKCRNLSLEEIERKISEGAPYVLRLRSPGNVENKFTFEDEIKGKITVCENDLDIVILKRDGIPTYHFAHVIDDHFMGTTLVVRGEEWVATLPIHLQLFELLGFERPKYAHTAQLMKIDNGKKRKLSKRHDPELSLEYYKSLGYHPTAVKTYLMTLLNSNFEEWFLANPEKPLEEFEFSVSKMGQSGALFDTMKLDDISKTVISNMEADDVLSFYENWVKEYASDDYDVIFADKAFIKKIIELQMAIGSKKRRKDFICAKQMHGLFGYYFTQYFKPTYDFKLDSEMSRTILEKFIAVYNIADDNETWFNKVKEIASELGFAVKMGDYKKNPDAYKGFVGDVAEIIRVAVTGIKNTPDLCTIMQIIGEDESRKRIADAINHLS